MMKRLVLTTLALLSGIGEAQSVSTALIGKNGWLFSVAEYGAGNQKVQIDDYLSSIYKLSDAFRRKNIKLYITVIPNKISIYSDMLPTNYVLPEDLKNQYESIQRRLAAHSVRTINLLSFLRQNPGRLADAPLWQKTDTHWSTLGAIAAGEFVAQRLASDPALQGIPEVEYSLKMNGKPTDGEYSTRDIIKTLSEDQKKKYQLGTYLFQHFDSERITPQDLLTQEDPQISLIGTSFSAYYNGIYGKSIAHSLKKDVLNVSEPGVGFWEPFYKYIKSDVFVKSAPKIIIWEIPERQFTEPGRDYLKSDNPKLAEVLTLLKK
jgi:alginate O-acetyltransferase complex protein AlgJ